MRYVNSQIDWLKSLEFFPTSAEAAAAEAADICDRNWLAYSSTYND